MDRVVVFELAHQARLGDWGMDDLDQHMQDDPSLQHIAQSLLPTTAVHGCATF